MQRDGRPGLDKGPVASVIETVRKITKTSTPGVTQCQCKSVLRKLMTESKSRLVFLLPQHLMHVTWKRDANNGVSIWDIFTLVLVSILVIFVELFSKFLLHMQLAPCLMLAYHFEVLSSYNHTLWISSSSLQLNFCRALRFRIVMPSPLTADIDFSSVSQSTQLIFSSVKGIYCRANGLK